MISPIPSSPLLPSPLHTSSLLNSTPLFVFAYSSLVRRYNTHGWVMGYSRVIMERRQLDGNFGLIFFPFSLFIIPLPTATFPAAISPFRESNYGEGKRILPELRCRPGH